MPYHRGVPLEEPDPQGVLVAGDPIGDSVPHVQGVDVVGAPSKGQAQNRHESKDHN